MQINNIEKTFDIINKNLNNKQLNNSYKNQILKAKEWCKKYEVDINSQSIYINPI